MLRPKRKQLEFRASDLESLLPEGQRARVVWGFVEGSDLNALYEEIKSREGGAGRSAIAPQVIRSSRAGQPQVPAASMTRVLKLNNGG